VAAGKENNNYGKVEEVIRHMAQSIKNHFIIRL